ncbi:MAG: hypothetical protein Q8P41_29385 [Pseudomonadota bacterium]|nr:hypothetical protein [Pseudomonadota bacterium]
MLVILMLLAACGEPAECVDRGDCGDSEICDLGTCLSVECTLSDDCGIDQYCDDLAYTCETGCETNDDCLAGQDCADDTHQCTTYGCRSTALDCAIGQQCDIPSGTCFDVPSCETCSGADSTECGTGACVDFDLDNEGGDHCLMPCLVADDPEQCPRGLECRDLSGTGDLYCYADCPSLQEELGE